MKKKRNHDLSLFAVLQECFKNVGDLYYCLPKYLLDIQLYMHMYVHTGKHRHSVTAVAKYWFLVLSTVIRNISIQWDLNMIMQNSGYII